MLSVISHAFDLTVTLVWGVVSLVTSVVYVSVELSTLLGYVIVGNGVKLFHTFFQIITGLVRLIIVLFEDYTLFVSDVCNTIATIFNIVQQCTESFYNSVLFVVFAICSCVSAIGSSFINIVTSVLMLFYHLLTSLITLYLLLKKTCLLVGSSVWNTFTAVPELLIALINLILLKVTDGYHFLHSCLQNGVKSILEFPVKPVCGLAIAIFLGFIVLKKRYSLWLIAYRSWLISTTQSQQLLLSIWQSFEGYVLWLLTNQTRDRLRLHFVDRPNENLDDSSDDSDSSGSSDDSNHNSHRSHKTLKR